MRPVNLIPLEERRGEGSPLRAGVASYVVLGVLGAALFAVVAIVLTGNSIDQKQADLASLQARQQQAQQQASELAPYATFASTAQTREEAVTSLAQSRFDWRRVLQEMSRVIPKDVWLESLTGSVAPGVAVEGGDAGGASDPSITGPALHVVGCGRSQDSVADLIAALKDIDGVTRVGIASSSLGDEQAGGGGAASAGPSDGVQSGDCQTRSSIAKFDVTLAFDAVPVSQFTPGSSTEAATAAPAGTSTTGTTGTTGATGATGAAGAATASPGASDDSGVAETQSQQKSANDSAGKQSAKAKKGASNVGVGG